LYDCIIERQYHRHVVCIAHLARPFGSKPSGPLVTVLSVAPD
jgi:hypothetical protein